MIFVYVVVYVSRTLCVNYVISLSILRSLVDYVLVSWCLRGVIHVPERPVIWNRKWNSFYPSETFLDSSQTGVNYKIFLGGSMSKLLSCITHHSYIYTSGPSSSDDILQSAFYYHGTWTHHRYLHHSSSVGDFYLSRFRLFRLKPLAKITFVLSFIFLFPSDVP